MSDSDMNDPPVPTSGSVPPPPPPPPPPAPPTPEPEPEPIFIAEQTPIPPSGEPAAPTPEITPALGTPRPDEPTSVMPPVPGMVPPPGGPGGPGGPAGPGGPMGPDDGEPDAPWYQKPGPVAVVVIVIALLVALLVWLFAGGGDDDDADLVETTVETTTSTLVETTTTLGATTTVEVTTTAAPETTAPTTLAPTTAAPTTAAPTTPPTSTTIPDIIPEPGETLWDVIEREDAMSELQRLIELAGLDTALQDPDATFTLFAPTNDAIDALLAEVGDPEDIDEAVLQNILLAHLNDQESIAQSDLLSRTEVEVMFGGPQPIDGDATPPTIGDANLYAQAPPAANGVLYAIDKVLQPILD